MTTPIVEMRGITKVFPGVVANDRIDFSVRRGEIHALLGENGAGKSTLMNILSGIYKPTDGEIMLRGVPVSFQSPRDALSHRICMIHQHFRLVKAFTVTENIMLGARVSVLLNRKKMEKQVASLAERYNMPVDPQARIWQLSVGEQQRVEILKALYRKADILILDEPTAVLTPQETLKLFDTLREMARQGCTIIIITHKLVDVVEIAHRVTVLRKGRLVGIVDGKDINYASLSRMMVGEELDTQSAPPAAAEGPPLLEVRGLTVRGDKGVDALSDVSFTLHAGEILGVAGVAGNGQRELGEALSGLRPIAQGVVRMDGRDITNRGPRVAQDAGLAFVPEDRLGTGLVGNMGMADNLMLRDYHKSRGMLLSYRSVAERVRKVVAEYGIVAASPAAPVRMMSGGNLQKLLLAREIAANPKALILAYPIRGLDIGAAEMVYRLMLEQKQKGCAILFISEDIEALLKYSDRIMVLCQGRVAGLMPREKAQLLEIGMMMMGTSLEKEARHEVFSHF